MHNHQMRIRKIGKTILENYLKWEVAELHQKELRIPVEWYRCGAFNNNHKPHPLDLKTMCDKLKIITEEYKDIVESTTEAYQEVQKIHMCQWNRARKECKIFRMWWDVQLFQDSVVQIKRLYDKGLKGKQMFLKHISGSGDVRMIVSDYSYFKPHFDKSMQYELSRIKKVCDDIDGNCSASGDLVQIK